jgi:hypothetical protein
MDLTIASQVFLSNVPDVSIVNVSIRQQALLD